MDWNGGGSLRVPFVSRPADQSSFSFLYNYNYDQFLVLEMKQPSITQATSQQYPMMPTTLADRNNSMMNSYGHNHDPKKKRLSTEQLESLENNFQEDIKLDPDRKMKLAKELGLQPRQIAVWFQNRRARWKGKQLERLYDALKQEYDVVSREKQKLQQEVMALRAMVKEQMAKKQVSTGYTEISGDETVESTSISSTDKPRLADHNNDVNNQISECNNNNYYVFNVDDYNPVMTTPLYWAAMPSNCP